MFVTLLQFFCPDGNKSSMAGLFFQTPEAGAIKFFHDVEEATGNITFGLPVMIVLTQSGSEIASLRY
ncbi:hypothetical protein MAR_029014 [Mya arenaria]|uniref:Uncharacterized protein n=1 Tax=Mya arenaria TaxID=6604 RepID=A0ABY7DGA1_MYAAR|nr:hypothetical protein MAR_029014 [Mya arenaria]